MSSIFRISKKMPIRSNSREINTGSTADIAFLLLIFFLVATTILNDMGLLVKLPPYQPDQSEPVVIKECIYGKNKCRQSTACRRTINGIKIS
jgi:biopolymer transport protein ExbD